MCDERLAIKGNIGLRTQLFRWPNLELKCLQGISMKPCKSKQGSDWWVILAVTGRGIELELQLSFRRRYWNRSAREI